MENNRIKPMAFISINNNRNINSPTNNTTSNL